MLKMLIGFALAFVLGAACRWATIPVPAPNQLVGALLVLAVTLGYLTADRVLIARSQGAVVQEESTGTGQDADPEPAGATGRDSGR